MIVYYTVSTYHILRSMLHKLNHRKNEDAILMVPSRFLDLPNGIKNGSAVFEKIIFYDWEFVRFENYPNDVYEYIHSIMEENLGEGYIDRIEEFNVFYAARFFGGFLADNGVHFNWFEEADGRYIDYTPPMLDDKRMHRERYENAVRLGLYTADNDCIDTIYLSIDDNLGVCECGKIRNFDVNTELRALDSIDISKVLDFWGVESNVKIPPGAALLLSQHFCNIRIMSFEEQVLMYQMFIDYFLDGKTLFLKMHPSDNVPYCEFIEGITDIKAHYPAELLQFVIENRFSVVAAVSSTGVLNLKNISDRQFCINQDFTHEFRNSDKYYFIYKLCELINIQTVICGEKDRELLRIMCEANNYQLSFFTHVDDRKQALILLSESTDIVLENIDNDIMKDNIVCIVSYKGLEEARFLKKSKFIAKKIVTEAADNSEVLDEKYVYIVTNDLSILDRIKMMEYYKLLKNTRIVTRVSKDDDKDTQINILSAMLEITEKALLKCVTENEELKSEHIVKQEL